MFPARFFRAGFSEKAVHAFYEMMADFLCPECFRELVPVESPLCRVCGEMFVGREGEDHTCRRCIETPSYYERARAAGVYDTSLMRLIHSLKYREKIQLAKPLGMLLLGAFLRFWGTSDAVDMVVPVPLHRKRLKSRGFNQAWLLVRLWPVFARQLDINPGRVQIRKDVLARRRWTDPQTAMDRNRRMKNMADAFYVAKKTDIRGKRLLLIDDVLTTGATVNECAKVLVRSGARRVDVLTLARTPAR